MLKQCKICKVFTTNLRRHKARNRCERQHIRRHKKEEQKNARFY